MGIVIGIDVGISTTKIVGIKNGAVVAPIRISANDPVTSLYGAFGKYLYDNKIELSDVEQVMMTGVGSAYIEKPVDQKRVMIGIDRDTHAKIAEAARQQHCTIADVVKQLSANL